MGCAASTGSPLDQSTHPSRDTLSDRQRTTREARRKGKLRSNLADDVFGTDIHARYDLKDGLELGEGAFAKVVLASHRITGRQYAVKVFKLPGGMSKSTTALLKREVAIMKQLDHPNIVRLQEVFHEERRLYMVMDVATGGDLQAAFAANRDFFKNEEVAATIVRTVLLAVRYCHEVGVCHQDIKLENIVRESNAPDAKIKLVDFGLSVLAGGVDSGDLPGVVAGTVDYLSPERVRAAKIAPGESRKPADLWAIGVLTYLLLSGYFPFYAGTDEGVKLKIRWGAYKMPPEDFGYVSADAKDFISRLMVKDPKKRMTAAEALKHLWMGRAKSTVGPVSAEVAGRFRKFGQRGGIQKLALEIIAHSLEPEQLGELEKEFLKVDTDNTGLISAHEFAAAMSTQGVSAEEAAELFAAMDIGGTNQLAFTEFLAAALGQAHVTEKAIKAAFERLDCDNEGRVTVAGLQNVVGADMSAEELACAVAEIDTDGIGEINYKQFRAAMRRSVSMQILDAEDSRSCDPRDGPLMRRVGSKDSVASLRSSKNGCDLLGGDSMRSSGKRVRRSIRALGSSATRRGRGGEPLGTANGHGSSVHGSEPLWDGSVRSGARSDILDVSMGSKLLDVSSHSGPGGSGSGIGGSERGGNGGGLMALKRRLSETSATSKLSKASMRNLAAFALMEQDPTDYPLAGPASHRDSDASSWSVGLALDESLAGGQLAVLPTTLEDKPAFVAGGAEEDLKEEEEETTVQMTRRPTAAAVLWPVAAAVE